MWNKILLLTLLTFPSLTQANEGKFSFVQQDEPAPFVGTLFDPEATARILANSKFVREEYELKLGFELSKQEKTFELELQQLQISLDTEKRKCETIISIKDQEIESLKELLTKKPSAAVFQGYASGFLVGAAATLLVVTLTGK